MSRVEPSTTAHRRRLAGLLPAVLGLGLVGLLAGCGSGQITQTDTQQPAVNGGEGTVGAIAVRDAELAYPDNAQGVYLPGSDARLIVTIVNTGVSADELIGITTPAALGVTIDGSATGTKPLPGGFAISSGSDVDDNIVSISPTTTTTLPVTTVTTTTGTHDKNATTTTTVPPTTTSGSAPTPPAVVHIVLTGIKSVNGASLRAGLNIPITFIFAHAGQVTVTVPIAAPPDNASYPATTPAGASG